MLVRRLRREADPPSSFDLQAYTGSPLPVLGVRAPRMRALARELVPSRSPPIASSVHARALELWAGRTLEERVLAIAMLSRLRDGDPRGRTWRIARGWVDEATGWALSDTLSGDLLGPMVAADRSRLPELARWARSRNPWRRRASLYALNRLVRSGELGPPIAQIERLLEDPEPWVQRAVGTWLRECWKQDPARIERFLRARAPRLSTIVRTVATERAPRSFRAELRTAAPGPRSARRPRRSAPSRGAARGRRTGA